LDVFAEFLDVLVPSADSHRLLPLRTDGGGIAWPTPLRTACSLDHLISFGNVPLARPGSTLRAQSPERATHGDGNEQSDRMILVTGGAGFIGSNFVLSWLGEHSEPVLNLDKLTYAGNLGNLRALSGDARHEFTRGDICDFDLVLALLRSRRPRAIVHFAAESHVDRSIHGPADFIRTNIQGTFNLLEAARAYYAELPDSERRTFRFLHVSTDEVYGTLGPDDPAFSETNQYLPNSPYAASKAAADHLVRAYHHTYGLPTLTTNCSNNYGPFQFPEKLIPLMISNALRAKPLPIYGDGSNVRDWLYVLDHCDAIAQVLARGRVGETYNIGGRAENTNLEVVERLCTLLDELRPRSDGTSYSRLMTFVKDRPGHDRRYAMDSGKIERELGWHARETFDSGIRKTVAWYLENQDWVQQVLNGDYEKWVDLHYAQPTR
jgi:dTDP-glucose 4,6-dehydratase